MKVSVPVNNSGQGSIFDNSIEVPDEIKGWNWGAFLMGSWWLFPNKVWIGLIAWVPYIGWLMLFVLGAKGNEWAWKSRKWDSVAAFKAHQRAWAKWSLIVDGSVFTLFFLTAFFNAFEARLKSNRVESKLISPVPTQETIPYNTPSPYVSPSPTERLAEAYPPEAINSFTSACERSFQAKAPTASSQIVSDFCSCGASELQQKMSYQEFLETDIALTKSKQNQQLTFNEQQKVNDFSDLMNQVGLTCRQKLSS